MTDKEMNALLHELRCRDEYALSSSGEQFALRELWEDLPQEREALKTLWGLMFPDDLAGVLVVAFGPEEYFTLLIVFFPPNIFILPRQILLDIPPGLTIRRLITET